MYAIRSYYAKTKFAHKGTNGHALLITGSLGKMGAAILSSKACLRTGSGLVTVLIPRSGNVIIQTANPEIMTLLSEEENIVSGNFAYHYDAVGIGPGIGKEQNTLALLKEVLTNCNKPLVIDADALNLLAEHTELRITSYNVCYTKLLRFGLKIYAKLKKYLLQSLFIEKFLTKWLCLL